MEEAWKLFAELDWPAAFALVASMLGGLVVVLSWLSGQISSWRSSGREYENLADALREVRRDCAELDKDLSALRAQTKEVDQKLARLTEMMIEYFSERARS